MDTPTSIDATPVTSTTQAAGDPSTRRTRASGALVGAVLGLAVTALVFVSSRLLGLADEPALALLVGQHGILSPSDGAPLVWVVPPLAAGIAGWVRAPSAVHRDAWAGTTMGFVAYVVAILCAPIVVLIAVSPSFGMGAPTGITDIVWASVVVVIVGSIVMAPFLVACVAGGILWALLLRRSIGASTGVAAEARPGGRRTAIVLGAVALVIGIGWLLFATIMQILVDSQGAVS